MCQQYHKGVAHMLVKLSVEGQLEIFFEVNSQATISPRSKQNFSENVHNHQINAM